MLCVLGNGHDSAQPLCVCVCVRTRVLPVMLLSLAVLVLTKLAGGIAPLVASLGLGARAQEQAAGALASPHWAG